MLAFITFSEAYIVSLTCSKYTASSVFEAFLLTVSAFLGMTWYAIRTKHDITLFYSVMSGVAMMMFGLILSLIFLPPTSFGWFMLEILMVIMSLVYVAIDT